MTELNTHYTSRTRCFELLEIIMRIENVVHSGTVLVYRNTAFFFIFEEIRYFLNMNTPTAFSSITCCRQVFF